MYFIDGGIVYFRIELSEDSHITSFYGTVEKIETIRIDNDTVADVMYMFSLEDEQYQYIEQSRTMRHDPLPPDPPDRIAQLETENLELKLALAELAEEQQTYNSRWPNWLKFNGGS